MNFYTHFPVFSIALTAAIIGAFLVVVIRKWVALHLLTSHHEVAFPIFLQLGVIYGVLSAFILSIVLNHLGESYRDVKIETTNLLTLAQLAPGFSEETQRKIDDTLIKYTKTVISQEWPKMQHRQEDAEVSKILGALQKIYLNIDIKTPREAAIYANSLEHLGQLRENRRLRIFAATQPELTYPALMLSMMGLIVIGVSYFFGMHRVWAQMILTGALIFTLVAISALILTLSNPFAGKFAITTRIFENTLARLEEISQGRY